MAWTKLALALTALSVSSGFIASAIPVDENTPSGNQLRRRDPQNSDGIPIGLIAPNLTKKHPTTTTSTSTAETDLIFSALATEAPGITLSETFIRDPIFETGGTAGLSISDILPTTSVDYWSPPLIPTDLPGVSITEGFTRDPIFETGGVSGLPLPVETQAVEEVTRKKKKCKKHRHRHLHHHHHRHGRKKHQYKGEDETTNLIDDAATALPQETDVPTDVPIDVPVDVSTDVPTDIPTVPTDVPIDVPIDVPTPTPTDAAPLPVETISGENILPAVEQAPPTFTFVQTEATVSV